MGEKDLYRQFNDSVNKSARSRLRKEYRFDRGRYGKSPKNIREEEGRDFDNSYKEGERVKKQFYEQLSEALFKTHEDLPLSNRYLPLAFRLMKSYDPKRILLGAKLYAFSGRDREKVGKKLIKSIERAQKSGATLYGEEKEQIERFLKGKESFGHDKNGTFSSNKLGSFIIFLIGILGGLFFLSKSLTGNVVGAFPLNTNWIGVIFLIVGLAGGIFLWRRRYDI